LVWFNSIWVLRISSFGLVWFDFCLIWFIRFRNPSMQFWIESWLQLLLHLLLLLSLFLFQLSFVLFGLFQFAFFCFF
jgi:hypothetical protein